MSNRVDEVVSAMIDAVRGVLREKQVSFDEYRQGVRYLMQTAESKELPLMIDLFFNTTICDVENDQAEGTATDLEGPYYKSEAPFVDGEIKTNPDFDGEPMIVRGKVTDLSGQPVENVVIDIWQSTPDGKYSGFHDNIPLDQYRGKVRTNTDGYYEVKSTMPVPYQIKHDGPVGALLEKMGRHSWRPAHVHFKTNKEGYRTVTTQAYFEGGDYVSDDCCEGMSNKGQNVIPAKHEDGYRIVDMDFVLDAA